ncbi:MAG: hypothetical protein RL145_398 [Pseudomonadota bacterium]|jgi:type IV secretion system protein VirB9
MTRYAALALLLVTNLHAPVRASESRLVSHAFNPGQIIRIDGRLGVQAVITFGDDERIENVAIGDSANWQVTPNKRANLLFVKPLTARGQTNLTVVTDRYTYFFDLVANSNRTPVYQLRFTYPEAVRPAQPSSQPNLTTEESAIALGSKADLPVDPAKLNFGWRLSGAAKLLPSKVYDDGRATYLSWASQSDIPALFMLDDKGNEGPVNYAVRADVIVVDGVPPELILRSGRNKAVLTHAPSGRPAAPESPPLVEEKN